MGIEPERVRLEWIAASEGDKVQRVINEMTAAVRRLGPLQLEPDVIRQIDAMPAPEPDAAPVAQGGTHE